MDGSNGSVPSGLLDRLNKVFHRFNDPNQGSRDSAISTFLATLKNHGIDLRDLEIVQRGGGLRSSPAATDFQGLRDAFKAIRIPEVAELEKLQETIDAQKITLAGSKESLRQAKLTLHASERQIKKLSKEVEKQKAKVTKAGKSTDSGLVKILRSALADLAPARIKAMTVSEFEEQARHAYGPRFRDVLTNNLRATVKPGAKQIPTWLKVLVWTAKS